MNPIKTIIIQPYAPGLGDHLWYSHLPRIAKIYGQFGHVLISRRASYRDITTCDLVWKLNPFVDGFTDMPGYLDKLPPHIAGCNLLDDIMLAHGLDDGLRGHEPEIYYAPPIINSLVGKNIYDPNFVSRGGFKPWHRTIKENVKRYFDEHKIRIDYQLKPRGICRGYIEGLPVLDVSDVWMFCSVIVSCAELFCFDTGTQWLAAAFKKRATVFHGGVWDRTTTQELALARHVYVNIMPPDVAIQCHVPLLPLPNGHIAQDVFVEMVAIN